MDGVSVKVLDAGGSPTSPLVWFSDDAEQHGAYKVSWGYGQHVEGGDEQGTASGEAPYSELSAEVPFTATTSTDGDTLVTSVTLGTLTGHNEALDDEGNDGLNSDIATAAGFRMTQTYGDDGRVTARTFAAPEAATGSARSAVEKNLAQMTDIPLVFPTDAVGTGARWSVTSQVEDASAGISMTQTAVYTLKSRHGSQVELGVTVDRVPTVKQMAGTDLQVMDSTSESTGSLNLDLRRPLPVAGSVRTKTVVTYGQSGSPVTVVQESRTTSTWSADDN